MNIKTNTFPSEEHQFVVSPEHSGLRLDAFMALQATIVSRSKALELIKNQNVLVNQAPVKPSYRVHPNDIVSVQIPQLPPDASTQPYAFELDIKYEDQDLIVVNKPSGLVSHPACGHINDTLVNALLHHTNELSTGFSPERQGLVHRLDKETSGLLVVAKTNKAQADLANQFKERSIHRRYQAICFGIFATREGEMKSYLIRHPESRKKFISQSDPQQGKFAHTSYRVLSEVGKQTRAPLTLVELKLFTGRTHQIRVHLSELGHPIVGDEVYGGSSRLRKLSNQIQEQLEGLPRFFLHAKELGFVHPRTREKLFFNQDWPSDTHFLINLFKF